MISLASSFIAVPQIQTLILTLTSGKRVLSSLGHCETATRLILLSRTAHPGMVVAGRCMKLKVMVYFDNTRPHSQRHGEKLLEEMLAQLKMAEAKKALVAEGASASKLAGANELHFITASAKDCSSSASGAGV